MIGEKAFVFRLANAFQDLCGKLTPEIVVPVEASTHRPDEP